MSEHSAYVEMKSTLNFLIVDIDQANTEALKVNLGRMGYSNFDSCKSVLAALDKIIYKKEKVEFIICRYDMGDMQGLDFFEELKNDLSIPRIPFLIFSEEWDKDDVALVTEKGVDAYLTIPFSSKQLADKVMKTWSQYIDPNNAEFHFENARRDLKKGNFDESIAGFKTLEDKGLLVHRAKIARALALKEKGEIDEALVLCEEVRSKFPKYVHGHQNSAEIYLSKDKLGEALVALGQAINISPKNPFRYLVISKILSSIDQWRALIDILTKAEKIGIHLKFVKENIAKAYTHIDEHEKAIFYYEKLVKREPNNISYLNNIAICYKKLEEYEKAVTFYRLAEKAAPRNTSIKYNLALLFELIDQKEEAINLLKKVIKLNPKSEKAEQTLLRLEDPEAYQEKMKAHKGSEAEKAIKNAANGESEDSPSDENHPPYEGKEISEDDSNIIQEETTKKESLATDNNIHESIQKILTSMDQKESNSQKDQVFSLTLSEEELKKLECYSEKELKYYYLVRLKNLRQFYGKLMGCWFKSIIDVSEDLVTSIMIILDSLKDYDAEKLAREEFHEQTHKEKINSIQENIKKIIEIDQELKKNLYPIYEQVQFQDYLRQVLQGIYKGYSFSFNKFHEKHMWDRVEKFFVTVHDKNMFKEIVKEEEKFESGISETNADGNVIFF